jgi:endoglucanase
MMKTSVGPNKIKGFLRAENTAIVNEQGENIILTGWGLGNWLLCEGYMWLGGGKRFDRPRSIEAVIRELTGSKYSERFWKEFRENYISADDIKYMAELGYNSVRLPINWRIIMEDEPGIIWKEEGFRLIDRFLDWCEEYGLYAFLDLHGAPGGQTGHNIDDSVDDFPRLFTDRDSWVKGIAIWGELARRYKDRACVGGYDLLNEPLRPGLTVKYAYNYLLPLLVRFYDEAIAEIRKVDTKHMISLEGSAWSTDTAIFQKKYDDNVVIHFHRYGCMPSIESFIPYLEVREKFNSPLWLGETGENTLEWYAAMYPLSVSLGIGYNLWTWKKMDCKNSPCSITKPENWDKIIAYANGGPRPDYEEAQEILDNYLENMKFENCVKNDDVTKHVFRYPGTRIRGTDFDLLPGRGVSYSGSRNEGNVYGYHTETGMAIVPLSEKSAEKRFFFDSGWDQFTLELIQGEFAVYSFEKIERDCSLKLELSYCKDAVITVYQDGLLVKKEQLPDNTGDHEVLLQQLVRSEKSGFKLEVNSGIIRIDAVMLMAP